MRKHIPDCGFTLNLTKARQVCCVYPLQSVSPPTCTAAVVLLLKWVCGDIIRGTGNTWAWPLAAVHTDSLQEYQVVTKPCISLSLSSVVLDPILFCCLGWEGEESVDADGGGLWGRCWCLKMHYQQTFINLPSSWSYSLTAVALMNMDSHYSCEGLVYISSQPQFGYIALVWRFKTKKYNKFKIATCWSRSFY